MPLSPQTTSTSSSVRRTPTSPADTAAGLVASAQDMKKHGVIHPELVRVLAEMGHTDELLICDAGFPIPRDVERIDLAYRLGAPGFADVVEAIASAIVVESAVVADKTNDEMVDWLGSITGAGAIERVPHAELKKRAQRSRVAVRTGETTAYSNVILVAGVAF